MSKFSHDIKIYLKDKKAASRIATDLAKCLKQFQDAESIEEIGKIDHNFVLSKGKVESDDANTDIVFDLPRDSEAYAFLKAMYADSIDEDSDKQIETFIKEICKCLTDDHTIVIRDMLRSKVICDAPEEAVPIKKIEVMAIELVDYSAVDDDDKYLLKFQKLPNIPINMQALMAFIMNVKENDNNTDKTTSQIINEEKLKGNKLFEGILGISRGDKYLWDVNISLFADYSFSDDFIEVNT